MTTKVPRRSSCCGDLVLSAGDYLRIGPGEAHDAVALEDSVFFIAHLGGAVIKELFPPTIQIARDTFGYD